MPMLPTITIVKSSGARERFRVRKIERSIRRTGASGAIARAGAAHVAARVRDGMTTAAIHGLVHRFLRAERAAGPAARYSLKDAMRRLGPAGYDFEVYVAAVLRAYGYTTELPELIPGMHIRHEVDVVARKDAVVGMIECKYRNEAGIHVHLKDVLATWARYDDLRDARRAGRHRYEFTEAWVVCNTRISGDGVAYGLGKGMRLLGWRFPATGGLERMIEARHLYPITILASLDREMQARCAAAGIMLCHDLTAVDVEGLNRQTGIPMQRLRRVRDEVTEVMRC